MLISFSVFSRSSTKISVPYSTILHCSSSTSLTTLKKHFKHKTFTLVSTKVITKKCASETSLFKVSPFSHHAFIFFHLFLQLYFHIHVYFATFSHFFFNVSFDICPAKGISSSGISSSASSTLPLLSPAATNTVLQQCPAVNELAQQLQLSKPRHPKRNQLPQVKLFQ